MHSENEKSEVKNSKTSPLIGLVLPLGESGITNAVRGNPFYSEFIEGMMQETRSSNANLVMAAFENTDEAHEWMATCNPDGMVFLGRSPSMGSVPGLSTKYPLVLVDVAPGCREDAFHIRSDDRAAARDAVSLLLETGHKRILYVSGNTKNSWVYQERYEGWFDAHRYRGIEPEKNLHIQIEATFEGGFQLGERLRTSSRMPDAIFCAADIIALGMMKNFQSGGLDIPRSVSIMGFDDISLCHMFTPLLSTVKQNIFEKGRMAARTVLQYVTNKEEQELQSTYLIPYQLLDRQSSCVRGKSRTLS